MLLSILDDGRVTDSKGRTVNFANTVIILTSNLGSEALLQAAAAKALAPPHGHGPDPFTAAKQECLAAAKRFFRPEFLNRLDDIVVFEPLQPQQLLGIARLLGRELATRLAPRNIGLEFTDDALSYAVQQAYDPVYGARPLRRWMEHTVITQLSRMIIGGQLPDNSDVLCDADPTVKAELRKTQQQQGAGSGSEEGEEQGVGAVSSGGLVYRVRPKPQQDGSGVGDAADSLFKRARVEVLDEDEDMDAA